MSLLSFPPPCKGLAWWKFGIQSGEYCSIEIWIANRSGSLENSDEILAYAGIHLNKIAVAVGSICFSGQK
ncbi:hypothetical protein U1Q18_046414 [Sarracenia purpurea var. burkii]